MSRNSDEEFESTTLLNFDSHDEVKGSSTKLALQTSNRTATALSLALILFFAIDILAFIGIARQLLLVTSPGDPDTMEFRNPYIGLDELYTLHPETKRLRLPYGKLINEPKLAAQVSSTDRRKVFPVDLHRWLSDFGILSPPDRRLQVTENIHTIVQFNVLDWGMEKCAVTIRLPGRSESLPHPFTLPDSGDTVSFEICELASERPFKESTLDWTSRPSCTRSLGRVVATIGGEVELEPFFCKSGSYLAYQVSCATPTVGCNVDVWSNQNQTWGIFLHQYQTV